MSDVYFHSPIEIKPIKNTKFTDAQLAKLRDVVNGRYGLGEDITILRKISSINPDFVGLDEKPRRYNYYLTEAGEDYAEELVEGLVSGHKKTESCKCGNCDNGYIRQFSHVAGGICFACNGTGIRK